MTALGSKSPDFLKEDEGPSGPAMGAGGISVHLSLDAEHIWGQGQGQMAILTVHHMQGPWTFVDIRGQPLNFQHIKYREIKKMSEPTPGEGEMAGIPGELKLTDPTSSRPRR